MPSELILDSDPPNLWDLIDEIEEARKTIATSIQFERDTRRRIQARLSASCNKMQAGTLERVAGGKSKTDIWDKLYDDKEAILAEFRAGVPMSDVAQHFGVGVSTLGAFLRELGLNSKSARYGAAVRGVHVCGITLCSQHLS